MTNGNGNSVVTLDARDGRLSEVASLARAVKWDVDEAKKQLPASHVPLLRPTMDAWRRSLRALKEIEPGLNGSEARKVKQAFLPLGAKMRPDMAEDKGEVWTNAIVAALSDLPGHLVCKACSQAMHQVFEFPAQLEQFLRDRAEGLRSEQWHYIARLRELHDAFYGTGKPVELPQQDDRPLSKDEIRDIVRIESQPMRQALLKMGSKWIDPELLEQVQTEERDAKA